MIEINKKEAGKIVQDINVKPFRTPARKKQIRTLSGVIIMILVLAGAAYWLLIPREKSYLLKEYESVKVLQGDLIQTTQASGAVAIPVQMQLISPEKGYAEKLYVVEGQSVVLGQLLATLSAPDLQDQLEDLRADLNDARLNLSKVITQNGFNLGKMERSLVVLEKDLTETRTEITKLESLVKINATRQSDLDNMKNTLTDLLDKKSEAEIALKEEKQLQALELEIRRADITQQETRLARLEKTVQDLAIKAPLSGEVMEYEASLSVPGSLITANQFLFSIADPSSAIVELELLEDYAGYLSLGQEISLSVSGQTIPGQVLSIGKIAQASSDGLGSTVQVKVKPLVPGENLLLGSTAVGTIELGKKEQTLLLPRGPYLTTGSQKYLYKVSGGTASRVEVSFGTIQGNSVEVLKGVAAGDEVIISGYQNYIEYKEIRLAKGE